MRPLRKFPKQLWETLARHYPKNPTKAFPKFLIANRNGLEFAATPTKQTIELISNRNIARHPIRIATLLARCRKGAHMAS